MLTIPSLPGTPYTSYASALIIEFERRTSTGPGTYSSVFYRFTNATQAITFNTFVFAKAPFNLSEIITDGKMNESTEVTFEDQNDVFKGLALLYDMLDWKAKVWEVGLDATFTPTWFKLKIAGRTEGVTWNVTDTKNQTVIGIAHDAIPSVTLGPREDYTSTCRFRFKSARCGYSGIVTTCNRLYSTCVTIGNAPRFGGFRHAPTAGAATVMQLQARASTFPPIDSRNP
jgi:hypothetical protein